MLDGGVKYGGMLPNFFMFVFEEFYCRQRLFLSMV